MSAPPTLLKDEDLITWAMSQDAPQHLTSPQFSMSSSNSASSSDSAAKIAQLVSDFYSISYTLYC